MTLQEATYLLMNKLKTIYSEGESGAITDWVMEHLTGSKKTERMLYKNDEITVNEEAQLKSHIERLLKYEPVQYILNESWFCGLKFYVDKNVLIPRPETEELVEWIISNCKFPVTELSILDVGSGSGCIPISLKRRLRKANVYGCDISEEALHIASKNAASLGADIDFIQIDFLDTETHHQLPSADIIVSNPPYIPKTDKVSMQANVIDHEPHMALFVENDDPLIFYKAIAEFGKKKLKKDGSIYTEIYENLGAETKLLFENSGFNTELKKDIQGKDRMIKATLN